MATDIIITLTAFGVSQDWTVDQVRTAIIAGYDGLSVQKWTRPTGQTFSLWDGSNGTVWDGDYNMVAYFRTACLDVRSLDVSRPVKYVFANGDGTITLRR